MQSRLSAIRTRGGAIGLAALVGLFLVITGFFNVLQPIWEAPEEPHHYAYIRYLAEHRALPAPQPHVTGRAGGENETHQTPLYYALQALLIGWVDDGTTNVWHRNPYVTWPEHPARYAVAIHRQEEAFPYRGYVLGVHLARLVSSLMGAGTVIATYLLARLLLGSTGLGLAAAALVAFTPGFAFLSATVNNDNGAILASSLVLLHCVTLLKRQVLTWRDGALSGTLLALAVLMKLSVLPLVVLVGVVWAFLLWRGRAARQGTAKAVAPLPVTFALLTIWWPIAIRDGLGIVLYSSAMSSSSGDSLLPPGGFSATRIGETLTHIFRTYWGAFGWTNELLLPDWLYVVLAIVCAGGLAGLAVLALGRIGRRGSRFAPLGLGLLVLYAVGSTLVLVVRNEYMPLAGVGDGRFLYPAIGAFSILVVAGLASLLRRFVPLILAFLALLAITSLSIPLTKSQEVFPPPVAAWALFDDSQVQQKLDLSYANGLTFLGLSNLTKEVQQGEQVDFDAYWRVDADEQTDLTTAFRLFDPNGEVYVSSHLVPQQHAFPPSFWQQGEVVLDRRQLAVPPQAVPGAYRLQMLLLDHTGTTPVPPTDRRVVAGWVDVAYLRVRPAVTAGPAVTLDQVADFGGELNLEGFTLAREGARNEPEACLTLYWRAARTPAFDYHVSVQMLDAQGQLRAQHDGLPHEGDYPPTRWDAGELVPDRHCLALAGAPPGQYQPVVVVYRAEGGARLKLSGTGQGYLPLTQMTVGGQ